MAAGGGCAEVPETRDVGPWDADETSLLTSSADPKANGVPRTYNAKTCYAICINYIIGLGVFSLPFAFYSAGLFLGVACLWVGGVFATITAFWNIETFSRAEGFLSRTVPPSLLLAYRKFDYTHLANMFAGRTGKGIVQAILVLYCTGVLWAFGAIFGSSISNLIFRFGFDEECDIYEEDHTQRCHNTYYLCVLLYGVIVVPLSCLDIGEQARLQVCLTIYRFVALFVMIITVCIGLGHPNPHNHSDSHPHRHVAWHELVRWSGFATTFTLGAVALNFHYNLPDAIQGLHSKQHVQKVLAAVFATTLCFYTVVGVLCVLYFGEDTEPLVTLNWQNYTAQGGGWENAGDLDESVNGRPPSFLAGLIQLVVMLFPVGDTLSVFALVAVTLGNNYYNIIPPSVKARYSARVVKLCARLLGSVPPVIFALALGEVDKIFEISGLFAFFLELFIPATLQFYGSRRAKALWGTAQTPYSSFFSGRPFVLVALIYGVAALVIAFIVVVSQQASSKYQKRSQPVCQREGILKVNDREHKRDELPQCDNQRCCQRGCEPVRV